MASPFFRRTQAALFNFCLFPFLSKGFLTAAHPFRLIVLSCLLTVKGWTEKPVDVFRSKARVELDFLLSLKEKSFKYCLSDGDSFGLAGLAQLLGVPSSLYI